MRDRACNIKYMMMTNKNHYESTEAFKTDPTVPVFLMKLQKGNNGLDMSVASHIVIFEPILSASLGRKERMMGSNGSAGSGACPANRAENADSGPLHRCKGQHRKQNVGIVWSERCRYSLFEHRKQTEVRHCGYGVTEQETLTGQELLDLCNEWIVCEQTLDRFFVYRSVNMC